MLRSFHQWVLRRLFLYHPKPSVIRIIRAWLEFEKILIESDQLDNDILHVFQDRIHDVKQGFDHDSSERLTFIVTFLPSTNLQLAFRQLVFAEEVRINNQGDLPTKMAYDYLHSMTLVELWRNLQTKAFIKRVGAIRLFWALPTAMSLIVALALLAGLLTVVCMVGLASIQGHWEEISGPISILLGYSYIPAIFVVLTILCACILRLIGRWFAATFVKRLTTQLIMDSKNNLNYAYCMALLQRRDARLYNFIERNAR